MPAVVHKLHELISHEATSEYKESWEQATFLGAFSDTLKSLLKEIGTLLNGEEQGISLSIDGTSVQFHSLGNHLKELESFGEEPSEWKISIEKGCAFNRNPQSEWETIYFLCSDEFNNLSTNLSLFNTSQLSFGKTSALLIKIYGFGHNFGSDRLAITDWQSPNIPNEWPKNGLLPDEELMRANIHVMTHLSSDISPAKFALNWGDYSSIEAKPFRVIAAASLASCLVHEHYQNRVVLKGVKVRKLTLLSDEIIDVSPHDLHSIRKVVEWCYEEDKVDTRLLLVIDRISLDASNNESYITSLGEHALDALIQAKSKFQYVIRDRKSDYTKELSSLQKDIHTVAKSLSDKMTDLISSLIKDTLGALFLVAINMFVKLGPTLDKLTNAPDSLFKGISVYLALSGLLRIFNASRDIKLSKKELEYWGGVTSNYLPRSEIREHINKSLQDRESDFEIWLAIMSAIYALLTVVVWCAPTWLS